MVTRRQFLGRTLAGTLLGAGCTTQNGSPAPATPPAVAAPALGPTVQIDLPLFDRLWELDPVIRERYPGDFRDGIAAAGLFFARPNEMKRGDYSCTPSNTLAFAWSGGDGEHYSFVVKDAQVNADSPVILTAPANSGNENHLLADSFHSFLRLGIRRGFFGLSQFAYAPEAALAAYGTTDAPGMESQASDPRQTQVLAFIAEKLDLTPLRYTADQYQQMQTRLSELLMADKSAR